MSSTATTTTTTTISLNVLPPPQPGGSRPAATAALANNSAPVAPPLAPVARPVANAAAIPATPGPKKSIVPKYKASTWLGMALAAAAIAVTVYYGQVMLRLARWSAGNDFRGSCVDDRSIGILSTACNSTLSEPARPPPMLRKRVLLIAAVFRLNPDYAVTIAVTVTAGAALLVARYTLFRRDLEARPLPVISPARTNIPPEAYLRDKRANATILQHRRKQHWFHDTRHDSDAEKTLSICRSGNYESSDDETVVQDDVDLDTVHADDASIYMVVRDVTDPHSNMQDLEFISADHDLAADDFENDGLWPPKGSRVSKCSVLTIAHNKATLAVLFDRAPPFEDALVQYTETSRLLQTLIRSSRAENLGKLEFIQSVYCRRIEELKRLGVGRPPASDENDSVAQPSKGIAFGRRPSQTRERANSEPHKRSDYTKAVYNIALHDSRSSHLDIAVRPGMPLRFPRWCQARHPWYGETGKDLIFQPGDLIEAINAGDGLWCEGRLLESGDFTGPFPSDLVEALDESFLPHEIEGFPLPPDDPNAGPPKDYQPERFARDKCAPQGIPSEGVGEDIHSMADDAGISLDVPAVGLETPSLRRRLNRWIRGRRDPLSVASSTIGVCRTRNEGNGYIRKNVGATCRD
ncbi:hypothetical protein LTR97_009543 [Elasticomyces elasticus]|uniref:SH3 domain-containing protein n=1 Tax=Elasticomyces elasticus TaxID=574655 RepID=A0AAN7ZWZ3_9PEZI|nr:hypothetical protein LTR97_009543 [Elasticomyces elasticus]